MPELPEAETISRGLDVFLAGRTVARVTVLRPDVVANAGLRAAGRAGRKRCEEAAGVARSASGLAAAEGKRVRAVGRRGKNVVVLLDDEDRIVVNLGMTGRLLPSPGSRPPPSARHCAVFVHLEGGGAVAYDDVRRFGRLSYVPRRDWPAWSARLGPEPLAPSFTARRLQRILESSKSPVRSLLLDQRKIAGIGNIYAVESLWHAAVHPMRRANEFSARAAVRLHRCLRRVLREAIRAQGTTLRNYLTASGQPGGFGPALRAYGSVGNPCPRCAAAIERIVFGGRSAFLCPHCQALPPAADR